MEHPEDWLRFLVLPLLWFVIRPYFTRRRIAKEAQEAYEQARKDYLESYVWDTGDSDEAPVQTNGKGTKDV